MSQGPRCTPSESSRSCFESLLNGLTEEHLAIFPANVYHPNQEGQDLSTGVHDSLQSLFQPDKSWWYDVELAKWAMIEKSVEVGLKVAITVRGGWMRTPILVFDDSELPATQLERRVTRESQLEIDSYYVSILTAMAQETWSTLERVGEVSWPLRIHLLVPNLNKCSFCLYSASVTHEYLDALDCSLDPFEWRMEIEEEFVTYGGLTGVLRRILREHPLIMKEFDVAQAGQESVDERVCQAGDDTLDQPEGDAVDQSEEVDKVVCRMVGDIRKLKDEVKQLAEIFLAAPAKLPSQPLQDIPGRQPEPSLTKLQSCG